METPEIKPVTQPEATSVQQQVESLRQLIVSVLILIVVISGTLNIYLWRQVKYTRADLASYRDQANNAIADYQRVSAPLMREFVGRLTEFSKSGKGDEALIGIMRKYGLIAPNTNAPVVAPTTGAAPAAPAPSKK